MALGKIAVLSTGHATAYGMFTAWREWSQKRGTIRLKELAEKERVDQARRSKIKKLIKEEEDMRVLEEREAERGGGARRRRGSGGGSEVERGGKCQCDCGPEGLDKVCILS